MLHQVGFCYIKKIYKKEVGGGGGGARRSGGTCFDKWHFATLRTPLTCVYGWKSGDLPCCALTRNDITQVAHTPLSLVAQTAQVSAALDEDLN